MYRKHHNGQLSIEEFVPFGGTLDPENRQGLLEVCPNSPGLGAAPTVTCAGTAPAPWPPSSPTTQSLQAI